MDNGSFKIEKGHLLALLVRLMKTKFKLEKCSETRFS